MASVALMVGGAIVNALAFTGGQYLFSKLGSEDAHAEQKRHDLATEQLSAAQAAWSKQRTERLDYLNEVLRRQQHAVQTFQDVDQAMAEYALVTGKKLDPLEREPRLSDYYVPSEAQKGHELAFMVVGMAVTGFITYKLTKRRST